jgi:hypothetical protein
VSKQRTLLYANPTSEKDAPKDTSSPAPSPSPKSRPKMPPHIGFVDLRTNHDDVLFKRFYDEMMIPGFPDPDGTNLFSSVSSLSGSSL